MSPDERRRMLRHKPIAKVWIMSFAMLLSQAPAFASNFLVRLAEKYYKQGEYQNAANVLALASADDPRNAYVHYMRGNALALLKQHTEAGEEYKIALALDRSGLVGQYSKEGLAALQREHKSVTPKLHPPVAVDTGPVPDDNLEMVEAKNRLSARCDAKIDEINKQAEDKIRAIDKERQDRLANNLDNDDLVNKEYGRKIALLRAESARKVADTSAYYAHAISLLQLP
jgi:tetratricopeptide (TPR) repeat protein